MSTTGIAEREIDIVERLVVSPDGARALLSLRFSPDDEDRMRLLMDKNNLGTIDPRERAEMEAYRHLGNLLGIIHAKARLHLKQSGE